MDHFARVGKFFEGDSALINPPKDFDLNTALESYGLAQQAKYGNNDTKQPFFLDFEASFKWKAWYKLYGMSQEEAIDKFIVLGE